MQIFSFDMMLIVLCQKRGIGPGYLIHDSHLFDGMDTRQIAKALAKEGLLEINYHSVADILKERGLTTPFFSISHMN